MLERKKLTFLTLRYNVINSTVKPNLQVFVSLDTSFVTRRTKSA